MIDSIDRQTKTIFTCILLLWGRGMCIAWCTHGGWRTICTSQISYHLSFRTQAQVHWAQQKVPLPAEPSWQSNICFIVYSKIKLRLFRNMHRKERGEKKGTDRHREEKKKKNQTETGSHWVLAPTWNSLCKSNLSGLQLVVSLLPLSSRSWDYRHARHHDHFNYFIYMDLQNYFWSPSLSWSLKKQKQKINTLKLLGLWYMHYYWYSKSLR